MISSEEEARAWLRTLPSYDASVDRRLEEFAALLVEENRMQNLIAASTVGALWRRHIADSAQLIPHVSRETPTWLDLGSGAGFPGLIAAILIPATKVMLVECRPLRAAWLRRVSAALRLDNVEVRSDRVQALTAYPVAVISARAFAPLDRLVQRAARFSTSGTIWLLPKGRSARDELVTLRGWRHTFHVEQSLTDPDAGIIVGRLLDRKE